MKHEHSCKILYLHEVFKFFFQDKLRNLFASSDVEKHIEKFLYFPFSRAIHEELRLWTFLCHLPSVVELGRVVQLVMCLATDASLTADPGVKSLIPARSNTFMEIDHEIISTVILLPSAESFKKDCCQFQPKVCAQSTG